MPIASIAAVAAAGDVLNISHAAGADQPDLLLQLTGAEAVADAFRVHQAALQQVRVCSQLTDFSCKQQQQKQKPHVHHQRIRWQGAAYTSSWQWAAAV